MAQQAPKSMPLTPIELPGHLPALPTQRAAAGRRGAGTSGHRLTTECAPQHPAGLHFRGHVLPELKKSM